MLKIGKELLTNPNDMTFAPISVEPKARDNSRKKAKFRLDMCGTNGRAYDDTISITSTGTQDVNSRTMYNLRKNPILQTKRTRVVLILRSVKGVQNFKTNSCKTGLTVHTAAK